MIPRYSLTELEVALPASHSATVAVTAALPSNVYALPGIRSAAFADCSDLPDMNAAAQAGLPRRDWFDELDAAQKVQLLQALANHPEVAALADQARPEWLTLLFGFADAEHRGVVGAREVALAWCKNSQRFEDENSFDRAWRSFKSRQGGSTVATLLAASDKAGFDLTPWREVARGRGGTIQSATLVVNAHVPAPAHSAPPSPGMPLPLLRGAPITQMPHFMTAVEAEAHLNARLCKVVDWGGTPSFGQFQADGLVVPLKSADLSVLLSGHVVAIPDAKDGTKHLSAASWWIRSKTKLVFDVVRYDPENTYHASGRDRAEFLARLRGPARKRQLEKDAVPHMEHPLWARSRNLQVQFLRWMAHLVQYPGTNPEVMIVIRSDREGAGKSSLGHWLLRIFGTHGQEIADAGQVFGTFNDALAAVSLVLLEEPIFPGDHRAAETLRAVLTARTLRINPKNRPAYNVPHSIHFMMTTNGRWAIPAGAEARRFLMLDVYGDVMPRSYFDALWEEANADGIAAMLHDLLAIDLVSSTYVMFRQRPPWSSSSVTRRTI